MSAVLELACAPDPAEGFALGGTPEHPRRIEIKLRNGYLFAKTSFLTEGKHLRTGEHMDRLHFCALHIHPRPVEDCCLSFGSYGNAPVTHEQAQILRDALETLGLRIETYGDSL